MTDIAQKIIEQKSYALEFITTVNAAKEAIFVYLLLPATYAKAFRQKLTTQNLNLKEHGVIIASGHGHTPSQDVKNHVLSKFPNAQV